MAQRNPYNANDYPIVVGIDFGTTFSGCSFAIVSDKQVQDITNWPKSGANRYPKVPTLILYDTSDKKTKFKDWGWTAKIERERGERSHEVLSRFKLKLDEGLLDASSRDIAATITAIADYLRAFHKYVVGEIFKISQVNSERYRYCLTVPATWTDKAKNVMRKAAIEAGIIQQNDHPDRLLLVTEPEAAALYCERKCDQLKLSDGDRFMVCDAGGGTVDLIVYEIQGTGSERRLFEVTSGHGASCGSVFVDDNFRDYIAWFFQELDIEIPDKVMNKLVNSFIEGIKPTFDGESNHTLVLPHAECFQSLENSEIIDVEDGIMALPAKTLRKYIFDPILKQIFELIDIQLQGAGTCPTVLLVGGFGSSTYILRRLQDKFKSRVTHFRVPERPEMAVVRGAVYAGLDPNTISARVSRRAYGIKIEREFETGVDPESMRVRLPSGDFCKNRFHPLITKGRRVNINSEIVLRLVIANSTSSDSDITIYSYNDNQSPPRYINDPRLKVLARIDPLNVFSPLDQHGIEKQATFKMFFGLSEIKAILEIDGVQYDTTLQFDSMSLGSSYVRN